MSKRSVTTISRPVIMMTGIRVFALCALALANGCQRSQTGERVNERLLEAASSVPVKSHPILTDQRTPMVKVLPRVDTGGDCAPRYRHGGMGSCINHQPCRGFAVQDPSGKVLCSCYGDIGGCASTQRCDEKQLTCVVDEEPPFNLSP